MTTPPDFGGHEIEEGRLEDLGGPQEKYPVPDDADEEDRSEWDDNELHAAGRVCARCGAVIEPGQDARLRADGRWAHEICPLPA
jgi:hypothetical protein